MNTNIKQLIALFALVTMSLGGYAQSLPALDWLMGEWYLKEYGSYERWTRIDNGYEGVGYRLVGGEEQVWEDMKLHQKEGAWVYTVSQKGSTPMDFKLTKVEGDKMTFENPENDFPTRIVYWRGESGPMAEIYGVVGADETTMKFTFEKPSQEVKDAAAAADEAMSTANSPLGSFGLISIGVKDLSISKQFYESLGFEVKMMDNAPHPWVRLSDGAAMVQLNQDGQEYFGLTYFTADIAGVEAIATEKGYKPFMRQESPVPMVVLVDPDTTFGIAVVQYADQTKPLPIKSEGSIGTMGEIAVPVSDLAVAAEWYESMGFKNVGKFDSPYPWGIYTDGIIMIGLHQTEHFDKPSITYFNSEAATEIERLQEMGLKVRSAMPEMKQKKLKYGVIDSPDGWPVNIFQGEM